MHISEARDVDDLSVRSGHADVGTVVLTLLGERASRIAGNKTHLSAGREHCTEIAPIRLAGANVLSFLTNVYPPEFTVAVNAYIRCDALAFLEETQSLRQITAVINLEDPVPWTICDCRDHTGNIAPIHETNSHHPWRQVHSTRHEQSHIRGGPEKSG